MGKERTGEGEERDGRRKGRRKEKETTKSDFE